jgi:hypothetical protein
MDAIPAPGIATWIQTARGGKLDLLRPLPEQINIIDIAVALARIPRFCGHTHREFPAWSVAQHSVLVAGILADRGEAPVLQMMGLLHDAHEYATGDLATPFKRAIIAQIKRVTGWNFDPVDAIQAGIQLAVHVAVGIPWPDAAQHAAIKRADMIALATEKRDLMVAGPFPWIPMPEPHDCAALWPVTEAAALRGFRRKFKSLQDLIGGAA